MKNTGSRLAAILIRIFHQKTQYPPPNDWRGRAFNVGQNMVGDPRLASLMTALRKKGYSQIAKEVQAGYRFQMENHKNRILDAKYDDSVRAAQRDPRPFRKSAFPNRVPERKPDRCFVYRSKKGYNVTAAWSSRRASRNFKTEKLAMKFARGLRCKVIKGSEFSRMPKGLRWAIQKRVPIIMKEERYPLGQAFAAAMSMAIRGKLRPLKRPPKKAVHTPKKRAKMKLKRKR